MRPNGNLSQSSESLLERQDVDGKASVLGSGVERRSQARQRASPPVSRLYLVLHHSTAAEYRALGLMRRYAHCAPEIDSPACSDLDGRDGRGSPVGSATAIVDIVALRRSCDIPIEGYPGRHKLPDASRCLVDHGVQWSDALCSPSHRRDYEPILVSECLS